MTPPDQDDLFTPRPVAPAQPAPAPAADISWLEKLLLQGRGWMTAGDIIETNKGRVLDRDIRAIASDCHRIISGQKGYKHVAHATPAEVNHSANWLVSQGKKMIKRGIAQRRAAHAILK